MNDEKDFLGTQPVGKLLMRLALPTVTAQIINMLYNIVDRIYIGHIPDVGAMALTGVGVCMPLIMIVTAFAAFVGYGGARGHLSLWAETIRMRRNRPWETVLLYRLPSRLF